MFLPNEAAKVRYLICRNGFATAGAGNVLNGGGTTKVYAATLRMLARMGEVSLSLSPDGGMTARALPERIAEWRAAHSDWVFS